jgi:hypothetical protein
MQTSEYIKNAILYMPRFYNALIFVQKNIPEFIGNGGKSFHTPLDSSASKIKGTNPFFRTIIQSDGDIINIIPGVDAGLNKRYQEKYQEHHDKVKRFCSELEGLSTITRAISALSGFAVIFALYRGLHDGIGLELRIYFCAILWTLFSFLFHKFISRCIFIFLIDLVVKNIKAKSF